MNAVVQGLSVCKMTVQERQLYALDLIPEKGDVIWKVWDGSHIYCICVSHEHAGAVKTALDRLKTLKRDIERKSFQEKVMDGKKIAALCSDREIQIIAKHQQSLLSTYSHS
jgi:hypothetical protein